MEKSDVKALAREQLKWSSRTTLKRALGRLPQLVEPGERVVFLGTCSHDGRRGLLAASSRRLLFAGSREEQDTSWSYDGVESIQLSKPSLEPPALVLLAKGKPIAVIDAVAEQSAEIAQFVRDQLWRAILDGRGEAAGPGS
ncbi:MAG TPA: hypothetical protein VF752_10705 [Thermoleophilaceae bacterium]